MSSWIICRNEGTAIGHVNLYPGKPGQEESPVSFSLNPRQSIAVDVEAYGWLRADANIAVLPG